MVYFWPIIGASPKSFYFCVVTLLNLHRVTKMRHAILYVSSVGLGQNRSPLIFVLIHLENSHLDDEDIEYGRNRMKPKWVIASYSQLEPLEDM